MSKEQAETANLQALLSKIGSGLDQYLKFEHPDALHEGNSWQSSLDIPLPLKGIGIDRVTEELIKQVIPNGSAVPKPGFTSYITTGAVSVSALASTAANIASPQRYMGTAFNFLEELSLQWLAEMCGIGELEGVYSSGGSVANLIALGGARQSAFEKVGHDVAANGVDRQVRIYASEECHHTIQRSGGVLGIGRRAIKSIACDDMGRMQVEALQEAIAHDLKEEIMPMAIVANAGSTNTGAIDPLLAIGEIAREHGIWYHIDGAYGLPGILDERISHLYQGLELADSVIVDPHKWLGAAVGIAATFVRDRDILQRAFTQEPADYLEGSVEQADNSDAGVKHSLDDFGIPYFDYGVELSSPCRGIVVWAMIREIGVEGMRERVKRHNDIARYIAEFSEQHPNLELLLEPTLSICCFRYVASAIDDLDQLNQSLHRRLVRENEYMPSTTRINGKLALRPCYIGARHEQQQAEALLEAVLRIGTELVVEQS
ncbi:MAG: aminotransferase class V-fold PLP-dependent enzyme [Gammaproteobacteria bacterium]|jgi:aromatic-L-amino-acid/L-tryptophan decarboxylase|nr:aminotransferase class V-fold PLP-dependent enzyme [Gammaproteobacteria bacterium]